MRSLLAVCLATILAAAACGGGSPSVTAPSPIGGGTPGSPGATTGATITGSVTTTSAPRAAVVSGPMATGLIVQVVGTSLSATVNPDGSFTLTGVPGGDVRLRFTGPGIDASCTIMAVQEQEQIQIKVTLTGSTAVIESQQRGNSDHASFPINGIVSAITKTPPTFKFTVNGQEILGDAATQFYGDGDKPDTLDSLAIGVRVEVKAERKTDGTVYAVRIHVNDDAEDDDQEVEFDGKITATDGAATPTLTVTNLSSDAIIVKTTTSTVVRRRGDVQPLTALQIGQTVEVEGTKNADGSVTAKKISIEDDESDGKFEIEGTLSGLKGTCPAINFGVNGYSIYTTSVGSFKDMAACEALRNGDKVEVKGTRQADGRVLASEVKKK